MSTQVTYTGKYTDCFNKTYFTFFKFLMNIDVKKLHWQKPVSANPD